LNSKKHKEDDIMAGHAIAASKRAAAAPPLESLAASRLLGSGDNMNRVFDINLCLLIDNPNLILEMIKA
jgi:hypothetical protein